MELRVLNTNFVSLEIIDQFQSLIWTERYGKYGDFELYASGTDKFLKSFTYDYYLWNKESNWLMIVEDIQVTSDFEDGNKVTVTGRSLESILDRRVLLKKTVLSGNLQEQVFALLDENISSSASAERKIDNFICVQNTDVAVTSLGIDVQYDSGTNLYDVIEDICTLKGLGFRIFLTDENQFVFTLFSGIDRSYTQLENPYILFSPKMENIINSDYVESKKTLKNVTFVEGEVKQDAPRVSVTVPSSGRPTGLDRRELYTDARGVSRTIDNVEMPLAAYQAQLATKGDSELKKNIFTKSFEAGVETTHTYVYGRDYFIGDIVQIVNEYEIESRVRISEVVRSQSITGIDIHPTFVEIT